MPCSPQMWALPRSQFVLLSAWQTSVCVTFHRVLRSGLLSPQLSEEQLLFIGHSQLAPDVGSRSNKEVGTNPLFMIYFHVSLQQQLMGKDTSDAKWKSAHLTHRPAVTAPQHWDILNFITVGMLDAELCKGHKYAGRFAGLFGFLFQVAEGFSSSRSNRMIMFPSAVEFAVRSSWMDTWFQGPSAASSKADARNISPAEKWVGIWTEPAGKEPGHGPGTTAGCSDIFGWCAGALSCPFPRELRTLHPSGECHGLWRLSKPNQHSAAVQTSCFFPPPTKDFQRRNSRWAIFSELS